MIYKPRNVILNKVTILYIGQEILMTLFIYIYNCVVYRPWTINEYLHRVTVWYTGLYRPNTINDFIHIE